MILNWCEIQTSKWAQVWFNRSLNDSEVLWWVCVSRWGIKTRTSLLFYLFFLLFFSFFSFFFVEKLQFALLDISQAVFISYLLDTDHKAWYACFSIDHFDRLNSSSIKNWKFYEKSLRVCRKNFVHFYPYIYFEWV